MVEVAQRIPKVFIAGVMKSGTTALYSFMSAHPCLSGAISAEGRPLKEIHYFSLYQHLGLDWYLSHFSEPAKGCMNIDASPTYFDTCNSLALPQLINSVSPEAKLILIVRNPVERSISHFNHLKFLAKEEVLSSIEIDEFFSRDFEKASLQLTDLDYWLHHVLWFSMFYRKFVNYREVFGDRILVIYADQLRARPYHTMNQVFNFLGVDSFSDQFFLQEIYTNKEKSTALDSMIEAKLRSFLLPDYQAFCELAASGGHSRSHS
jgi:hypothetical protein